MFLQVDKPLCLVDNLYMRTCIKCKKEKEITDFKATFYITKNGKKTSYTKKCKKCHYSVKPPEIIIDSEGEEWRDVVGYEGLYKISNYGRLKTFCFHRTGSTPVQMIRILKDNKNAIYRYAGLSKDGKVISNKIHRLVAKAFLPNPENKPYVNHINGNKHDNCASNLEWTTPLENNQHAIKTGLTDMRGEKSGMSKLTNKDVINIRELISSGIRTSEIAKIKNVSWSTISCIKKGRTWKHI